MTGAAPRHAERTAYVILSERGESKDLQIYKQNAHVHVITVIIYTIRTQMICCVEECV